MPWASLYKSSVVNIADRKYARAVKLTSPVAPQNCIYYLLLEQITGKPVRSYISLKGARNNRLAAL